ncbi:uncharacterized protein C594.04c-like [Lytechinus variegatus]|uniref:uncharacterized protein C594.04c-like n=1 Tax=Lytechinus variegatus TaxID=7654 RepID=UPI001BB2BFF8|nr:uncharacterized protein C594.04c-like [Lytechinus variegatus]
MGNSAVSSLLVKSAVWDVGIQWSLFLIAAYFKTEKFYDLAGSGTFLLLATQSLRWGGTYFLRQRIQTGLVSVWATRLGLYLFSRVLSDGFDRRFNKAKNQPSLFFVFWTLQALWIFATLSPSIALNGVKRDKPLGARDYIGWGTWAVGFLMEVIADRQKSVFKANPANAGKFINTGLWSISRHPNYFGEILCWLGLYVSASSSLTGWEHLTAISPIFVTLLLTKVSGIPLLEKYGLKKWGSDPSYQNYLRKTAVLVPFLW